MIKVWDDRDDEAKLRPAILKVTLSTGDTYVLSEANGWCVTVSGLPKYVAGVEQHYTWSEQSVLGYSSTVTVTGDVTTFTNYYRKPGVPRKPYQPAAGQGIVNNNGDCFD